MTYNLYLRPTTLQGPYEARVAPVYRCTRTVPAHMKKLRCHLAPQGPANVP